MSCIDACLIEVDAFSVMHFKAAIKSIDTPMDSNGNNIYDFWLSVNDGDSTINKGVQVTVLAKP